MDTNIDPSCILSRLYYQKFDFSPVPISKKEYLFENWNAKICLYYGILNLKTNIK